MHQGDVTSCHSLSNHQCIDRCFKSLFLQTTKMSFGIEQEGGSLIVPMALARPLHPINDRSRNKRRNLWVGWCVSSWWPMFSSRSSVSLYIYLYVCILYMGSGYRMYIYIHRECHSVLVELHPITVYMAGFWERAVPLLNATCCFIWFQPFVSYSMVMRLILGCLWPLVSVLNYILTLGILRSVIFHLPGCFCPWTFFLCVTSIYWTRIFYRGVSGFATDCPCGVWCRGLTTCLLYVGPLFGYLLLP